MLPWLDNWIEAAQRELGRHKNEDEAFEAARLEAERRFKAGLQNPSSALMDEFAREERAEAERQDERKRRQIRLLEEAIRFDELSFEAEAAVQKLRRVAKIEGRSSFEEIGAFLLEKGGEYYERGNRRGENSALLFAIAAYRAALEELTRERVPLNWAKSFGNEGVALMLIAERTRDASKAKTAYDQIEAAAQTAREGGDEPTAAYFEAQLPKAQSLVEGLSGR